ncbi:MAG: D-2-hydroxyacid dehydrogenase, partial [Verrucomicrobia bacterium]|nr:D-2-hydroxyacid dehydrogenase [Verrucomicrobiota bacterium]
MKLVVLDSYTLNPGDLSWDELRSFGECDIHDRTPTAEIVKRAAGAEIVLTNKTVLTREQILALPALRYIGVLATGHNIVDSAAARERGVPVCNVPAYGTRSVAQMTFALLLELCHRAGHHARTVSEGRWSTDPDWCYWDFPLVELEGLSLGVVGFGRIGLAVAELGRAFGMNVVAHTRTPPANAPAWVKFIELEKLFHESDVVSLHCPLTPQTQKLVNAARLAAMKPSAFLLNTSRGPLIDEPALAEALNAGRIAGAGLDVLTTEPPPAG